MIVMIKVTPLKYSANSLSSEKMNIIIEIIQRIEKKKVKKKNTNFIYKLKNLLLSKFSSPIPLNISTFPLFPLRVNVWLGFLPFAPYS